MANVRIKDKTAETEPARGSVYVLVDSAAGGSKAVLIKDLIGNGFADYNDLTTTGTPITPTTSTWTKLTNDKAGSYTNTSYLPSGVTDMWDTTGNQFDFSELSLGDQVDIRFDVSVTTTSSNQVVRQRVRFDIGGTPYNIEFDQKQVKAAGTFQIVKQVRFYMGSSGTINNPAEWQIWTDGSANVTVNGVYISVTRR